MSNILNIKGTHNTAKIFTNVVNENAIQQVQDMCELDFLKDTKIRMMPDIHFGKGCTIGTTIKIKDKVVPNHVGVDIGCGISSIEIDDSELDFEALDNLINTHIPTGSQNYVDPKYAFTHNINEFVMKGKLDAHRVNQGLGTLGGGNHFIEVSRNEKGRLVLTIHTGSRYLGATVANHYQKIANTKHKESSFGNIVEELKSQGRHKEIEAALNNMRIENQKYRGVDLFLEGQEKDNYMNDLNLAQIFATQNRVSIAHSIVDGLGLQVIHSFDTIHNYIDVEHNILRKGAVSAKKGEELIIPINMRDGSIIAVGKGNEDWNYSAPHGAGRLFSRNEARKRLELSEFEDTMKDVWSKSVVNATLDEAPEAYKSLDDIRDNISDTVDIKEVIKPVYNYKAKEEPIDWSKRRKNKSKTR